MTLPDEAKKMGAPPHWMSNVQVANVDATVAAAKKAGARVYKEPSDIPKVGRFAVIADPQGASLSVFAPNQPMTPHDDSKHGAFSWNELLTTEHESAFRFYADLFGWKRIEDHDLGAMGKYLIYGVDGKRLGGMFTKTKEMPMPPSWMYYVHVDDLEAAVGRAKSKGGKVLNGPMDVPGGDRIAQLMDPQGAAFALHESAKKK
jgi:predicted enzyme related to lactoylglutathione lyase